MNIQSPRCCGAELRTCPSGRACGTQWKSCRIMKHGVEYSSVFALFTAPDPIVQQQVKRGITSTIIIGNLSYCAINFEHTVAPQKKSLCGSNNTDEQCKFRLSLFALRATGFRPNRYLARRRDGLKAMKGSIYGMSYRDKIQPRSAPQRRCMSCPSPWLVQATTN